MDIVSGTGLLARGDWESDMSLKEILAKTREASAGRIAPDKRAIMHRATEDLRRSGILDRIVRVGEKAPDFTLAGHNGETISSVAQREQGPLVVSFFRGSW